MKYEGITNLVHPIRNMTKIAILALALVGAGISGYLTYIHLKWVEPICLSGMDCHAVLFSPYAEVFGMPISVVGLTAYGSLIVGGLLLFYRQSRVIVLGSIFVYTFSLSGLIYSLYLLYLEAFKIHAYCSWCMGSGLIMVGIFICSVIYLYQVKQQLNVFTPESNR